MKKEHEYSRERKALVDHLMCNGITDGSVLNAMENIPRHLFLEKHLWPEAYKDSALPVECGQTISQPYIVARMTMELCQGQALQKVLEVGTGTGYQAAILSQLVKEVYTIERIEALSLQAGRSLRALKIENVHQRYGDGFLGWKEHAPYQGIIVTAAPLEVPKLLMDQLDEGGRMIIPVGDLGAQVLMMITRNGNQFQKKFLEGVRFVPLLSGVR